MRLSSVAGVRELLVRGLASMPTVSNTSAAVDELEQRLQDPEVALFVQGRGFLIAENNRSAFVDACCVIHFYTERAGELARLLDELIQFAREGGLERFHGVDINCLSTRAYCRLLKGRARELRPIGTFYEVRV